MDVEQFRSKTPKPAPAELCRLRWHRTRPNKRGRTPDILSVSELGDEVPPQKVIYEQALNPAPYLIIPKNLSFKLLHVKYTVTKKDNNSRQVEGAIGVTLRNDQITCYVFSNMRFTISGQVKTRITFRLSNKQYNQVHLVDLPEISVVSIRRAFLSDQTIQNTAPQDEHSNLNDLPIPAQEPQQDPRDLVSEVASLQEHSEYIQEFPVQEMPEDQHSMVVDNYQDDMIEDEQYAPQNAPYLSPYEPEQLSETALLAGNLPEYVHDFVDSLEYYISKISPKIQMAGAPGYVWLDGYFERAPSRAVLFDNEPALQVTWEAINRIAVIAPPLTTTEPVKVRVYYGEHKLRRSQWYWYMKKEDFAKKVTNPPSDPEEPDSDQDDISHLHNCRYLTNIQGIEFIPQGFASALFDYHASWLEDPPSMNECGYMPLFARFLDSRTERNHKDEYGYTALHEVAYLGYLDCVQKLVQGVTYLANLNSRDCDGRTPLSWAVQFDHQQVVEYLLQSGAEVDLADINGFTPLHIALITNNMEMARMLLYYGADRRRKANGTYGVLECSGMTDAQFNSCFHCFGSSQTQSVASKAMLYFKIPTVASTIDIEEILDATLDFSLRVAPYADQVTQTLAIGYNIERGLFTVITQENGFTARAIAHYQVMGQMQNETTEHVSYGYDEPRREVAIELKWLVDIDANWNLVLEAKSTVNSITGCDPTLFQFDISTYIANIVHHQVAQAIPVMKQRITEQMNLRENAQKIWKDLSEPYLLCENKWIQFQPQKFHRVKQQFKDLLPAIFNIECDIVVTSTPEQQLTKLPPMTLTFTSFDAFRFKLSANIHKQIITQQIAAQLVCFKFPEHVANLEVLKVYSREANKIFISLELDKMGQPVIG